VAGVIGLILDSLSPAARRGQKDPVQGDPAPRL
jgi:signal peptidase II